VLRIELFGGFRAYDGSTPIERFAAPKVEALFGYLLLNRGRLWSRESLMDLFWGDVPKAEPRSCLNSSLTRLRNALAGFHQRECIIARGGYVGLDEHRAPWLDVAEFELAMKEGMTPLVAAADKVRALKRADDLYRGPLLEGVYETWSISERERLERVHLGILEQLMRSVRSEGRHLEAIAYGARILEVDPLREDVHRDVMRLQNDLGQRAEAGKQYMRLRHQLHRDLGIEPMPETSALWREISGSVDDPRVPAGAIQAQLESTLRELDEIQQRLRGTLEHLKTINQGPRI